MSIKFRPINELVTVLQSGGSLRAAVVTGAGMSAPYPTANRIKMSLGTSLARVAVGNEKLSEISEILNSRLFEPFMTLENIFFLYEQFLDKFDKSNNFRPNEIIRRFLGGLSHSAGSVSLALLRCQGKIGPIITPNFDTLLYSSLNEFQNDYGSAARYRLKTDRQFSDPSLAHLLTVSDEDIVAFHGTLAELKDTIGGEIESYQVNNPYTDPNTLVARGLMRPFKPGMAMYLESLMRSTKQGRDIIFFGYRGEDFYDLNMLFDFHKADIDMNRLHWVSFAGDGSDISDFAKSIGCNYYGGDFASAVIDHVAPSLPLNRFGLASTANPQCKYTAATNPPIPTDDLFLASLGDQDFRDRANDLIDSIRSRFTGAWAVTEHYSLESYGFGEKEIRALGRPKVIAAQTDSPINYLGIDVGRFIDAQESYWGDNKQSSLNNRSASLSHEKLAQDLEKLFPSSYLMFLDLLNSTGDRLRGLGVDPGIPELSSSHGKNLDVAMMLILHAIAYDYIGLMINKLTDFSPVANREAMATTARRTFERTTILAESARSVLGREVAVFGDDKALRDMVPYLIWSLIGRDNSARAIPDYRVEEKLSALRLCVERRTDLIQLARNEGLDEEATYFLPQTALRCTEAYKAYFGCSDPSKMPVAPTGLASSVDPEWFLTQAQSMRDEYISLSIIRNRRFITVYDCEILKSIIEHRYHNVPHIIDALIKHYAPDGWLLRDDIRGFARNVLKRCQIAAAAFQSSDIGNAAQRLENELR